MLGPNGKFNGKTVSELKKNPKLFTRGIVSSNTNGVSTEVIKHEGQNKAVKTESIEVSSKKGEGKPIKYQTIKGEEMILNTIQYASQHGENPLNVENHEHEIVNGLQTGNSPKIVESLGTGNSQEIVKSLQIGENHYLKPSPDQPGIYNQTSAASATSKAKKKKTTTQ